MFLKKKNIPVIIFSSIIIGCVFFSSLFMMMVYFRWKEKKTSDNYNSAIYGLTADIFRKDIAVLNIKVVPGEVGVFSGKPFVEGSIKNNSSKTIASILMEITFVDKDGVVVYKHDFHPFGTGPGNKDFGSPILYPLSSSTDNILLPGDSISFRHVMSNCSNNLVSRLGGGKLFSSDGKSDDLRLIFSITGVSTI